MGPLELVPGDGPGRWSFAVTPESLTPARAVQGGVLMGALVEAIERTTGRPVVWSTGRYLRHVGPDAVVAITVTIDVDGHATTQASAVGVVDGIAVIGVWAAAGHRDFPISGTWAAPPTGFAARLDSPRYAVAGTEPTMADAYELRLAGGRLPTELDGTPGPGPTVVWMRVPGGPRVVTAADLAVMADFSVIACSDALGRRATGNSLDNTLRIVERADTDHLVAEFSLVASAGGFGQFESRLWSEDGRLLAIASTTLVLRIAGPDGRSERTNRRIVGGAES